MVEIKAVDKGRVVGQSRLQKGDLKKVFDFCKSFDISMSGDDSEFLFDVRSGVIHWLDKQTKEICSSLYLDEANGTIRIEMGDANWSGSTALEKWKEVLETALAAY